MAKERHNYSSEDIQTLAGLAGVRLNASMYLGSTDAAGRFLSARELLDNALDEFLAGRNASVSIFFHKDGSYTVVDEGEGIPQGIKAVEVIVNEKKIVNKIPTMQAIFGDLHTSGKYRSDAYKVSVGTHGIGAKGTNATSLYFQVYTIFKGKCYSVRFEKGVLKKRVTQETRAPKLPNGQPLKRGTMITFLPDPSIYSAKSFPPSMLGEWAEVMAYLNPGFRITAHAPDGKSKTWFSKLGPVEYVQKRQAVLKVAPFPGTEKYLFQFASELADVVVSFTTHEGAEVRGFTNGLNNADGGKHVDSVMKALFAGIQPQMKRGHKFTMIDFRDGLVGLVNAKLHKAQFSGQSKAKLTDDRVGAPLEKLLTDEALAFFAKNKTLAQILCEKATKFSALRSKFKASANTIRELNRIKRQGMPAKYAAADPGTKTADRELYLIEGDSAAGTVKQARFPFQAALPLKGKPMNAMRDPKDKAQESEEIINVFGAMGFDPKAHDPYAKLLFGKVIILADPDFDGPLVHDTPITVFEGNERKIIAIGEMSGKSFVTEAWNGHEKIKVDAYCKLVRHTDQIVSLEIGKAKYKCDADHKWAVLSFKSFDVSEGRVTKGEAGLHYKKASDLKPGDRVFCPGSRVIDKASGLEYALVTKVKPQNVQHPVPVYCLTVDRWHNFVLPTGIVSGNCHIISLLLGLFYKFLPELFDQGRVYVAETPEFYAEYKKALYTGDKVDEVRVKLNKVGAPASHPIQHIKGWGEIDAELMRVLAMDPKTRTLVRIKKSQGEAEANFVALMGDDVNYRKQILGIEVEATNGD